MAAPILVTGGAGYIGSHTVRMLAGQGRKVVVLDNLVYGHRWAVRWGPFYEGDVADAELFETDGRLMIRDLGSTNGTYANGDRIAVHRLADGDKIQIAPEVYFKFTLHDELEHTFREQMYDAALRDPLTKAYNKRYFLEALAREIREQVGYMPESECIIPGLHALDVVAYLGRLSGMPRRDAFKRAHEVLYYVGLGAGSTRVRIGQIRDLQHALRLGVLLLETADRRMYACKRRHSMRLVPRGGRPAPGRCR